MFDFTKNIFSNWDKELYIANKKEVIYDDYNNEIVTYNEPIYVGNLNYQPLTGKNLDAYIQSYGETSNDLICCFLDKEYDGIFKPFDLAYLYGNTPKDESVYGENANYIVKTYREQNTKIMVIFEKLIKEEN